MNENPDHDRPSDGADKPTPSSQEVPKDDTPDPNPSANCHTSKPNDSIDRAMVRWTRVVGIFTIVLALVGAIQAYAFIQSERAAVYVNIERIIPYPIASDKPVFAAITVINNGRSQAFMVGGEAQMAFYYKIPKKPSFLKSAYPITGVVPAHGRRVFQIGPSNNLNWAQVDEINSGKTKVIIFGFISYIDDFTIFGHRTVGFCGIYHPKIGDMILSVPPLDGCNNPNYEYYR